MNRERPPDEERATGFVPVIGLEIHVQLLTRSKMFCACAAEFDAQPNTRVCPVCLGMPGALPVVNRRAVEMALAFGAAVGARIHEKSLFARKNYFYPDLPKGYQITQVEAPICEGGELEIETAGGEERSPGKASGSAALMPRGDEPRRAVVLERAHLEEDSARSIHDTVRAETLLDMNRAGVPLLEIVTRPELRSPAGARRALDAVKRLVQYLGISSADMEKGSLRCDANVSLGPAGGPLGVKTEIKNLNSVRALERSLAAEIERQRGLLAAGGAVRRETLLWDEKRREVAVMRVKEGSDDYRCFPEPDLPPLVVTKAMIAAARAGLPELPLARERRLRATHALPAQDARLITATRELADLFETLVARGAPAKAAANLVNESGRPAASLAPRADALAELASLFHAGRVSSTVARELFRRVIEGDEMPSAIVEREGLAREDDAAALEAVVRRVIAGHPGPSGDFRAGKEQALEFLVGAVMKATHGRANAALARDLLAAALRESFPTP